MLKKIVRSFTGSALKRSRPDMKAAHTVVFNHIPKTAGMSFHAFIKNNIAAEEMIELYTPDNRERLQALTEERKASLKAIVGHLPLSFFAGMQFQQPLMHVTVLRDPVDRIISYYHYIKASQTHYLHDLVNQPGMTLRAFIEQKPTTELDNLQLRYLCTTDCWNIPFGGLTREMLAEARSNLEERFAIIGLQEEFAKSLQLAAAKFGFANKTEPLINATAERPLVGDIDERDVQFIKDINELDIELYKFAGQLFNRQLAEAERIAAKAAH